MSIFDFIHLNLKFLKYDVDDWNYFQGNLIYRTDTKFSKVKVYENKDNMILTIYFKRDSKD